MTRASASGTFLGRVKVGSKVASRQSIWRVKDIWVDIGYDSDGHYEKVSDTWLVLESLDGRTTSVQPYYRVFEVLPDD